MFDRTFGRVLDRLVLLQEELPDDIARLEQQLVRSLLRLALGAQVGAAMASERLSAALAGVADAQAKSDAASCIFALTNIATTTPPPSPSALTPPATSPRTTPPPASPPLASSASPPASPLAVAAASVVAQAAAVEPRQRRVSAEQQPRAKPARAAGRGHVMVSYSWNTGGKPEVVEAVVKRLRERRYKVWFDKDHMSHDFIDKMADAVENADVFVMCLSQPYQATAFCRMHAYIVMPYIII